MCLLTQIRKKTYGTEFRIFTYEHNLPISSPRLYFEEKWTIHKKENEGSKIKLKGCADESYFAVPLSVNGQG